MDTVRAASGERRGAAAAAPLLDRPIEPPGMESTARNSVRRCRIYQVDLGARKVALVRGHRGRAVFAASRLGALSGPTGVFPSARPNTVYLDCGLWGHGEKGSITCIIAALSQSQHTNTYSVVAYLKLLENRQLNSKDAKMLRVMLQKNLFHLFYLLNVLHNAFLKLASEHNCCD